MRMTNKKTKRIEKNSAPINAAANHEASSISCSSSDNPKKSFRETGVTAAFVEYKPPAYNGQHKDDYFGHNYTSA